TQSMVLALCAIYLIWTVIHQTEEAIKKEKSRGNLTTPLTENIFRYTLQFIITVMASFVMVSCAPFFGL
ncbi:hypothetical protein QWY20_18490, partial [Alkalimonas sp. MEB108]